LREPPVTQTLPGSVAAKALEVKPRGQAIAGAGVLIRISVKAAAFAGFEDLLNRIRAAFARRSDASRRQGDETPIEKVENSYWLLMHELNGTAPSQTWVPVGPTGAVVEADGGIRAFVLSNTLNTYVPIIVKGLPSVNQEFDKYITTSGNEVYSTICVASFLFLLSFVVVFLPCCMPESTKPPLPAPPVERAAPPAPVVISPPPPPPAPVFVREVEPQMRYNVQGAPIKHFGPPIGGSGWKPAPQTEYTVPIRTSPETEGQLGFSDGFGGGESISEAPQVASRNSQYGGPAGFNTPTLELQQSHGKPYGYG